MVCVKGTTLNIINETSPKTYIIYIKRKRLACIIDAVKSSTLLNDLQWQYPVEICTICVRVWGFIGYISSMVISRFCQNSLIGLYKRQSSFGGDGWLYVTFSLECVWTEVSYLHVRLDLNEASELWEAAVLANKDFWIHYCHKAHIFWALRFCLRVSNTSDSQKCVCLIYEL